MSKSYQHEIPQARVNITLDVETGGLRSKKELPMKLLMLGDFSHGQAKETLRERETVSINRHNFNQVLEAINPGVAISVKDCTQPTEQALAVELNFKTFSDFSPEQIVEKVPQLKRLMAMRNLLKDLKSSVIDNQSFRKALEKIMKNDSDAKQVLQELIKTSPIDDTP